MSLHTDDSQTTDMMYYIMAARIVTVNLSISLQLCGDLCNVRRVFLESLTISLGGGCLLVTDSFFHIVCSLYFTFVKHFRQISHTVK